MSQVNENMSNGPEKGDQIVVGPRIKTDAVEQDDSDIVKKTEAEENHTNSTTSSLMANLSRRRYLNRNDELRTAQAMKTAAESDPYEIKEVMARGAESVLYRSVCGSFTFCAKAIRNNWNKLLGSAGKTSEKLDNVAYHTKVRHLQNEFAISQMLTDRKLRKASLTVFCHSSRRTCTSTVLTACRCSSLKAFYAYWV